MQISNLYWCITMRALFFLIYVGVSFMIPWTMNPRGHWVHPETHFFQCNLLHIVVWCLETGASKRRVFFQWSWLDLTILFWKVLVRCMRRARQKPSCPFCEKNPLLMFNGGLFGECLLFGWLFSCEAFRGITELGALKRSTLFHPLSLQMRGLKFRVVKSGLV